MKVVTPQALTSPLTAACTWVEVLGADNGFSHKKTRMTRVFLCSFQLTFLLHWLHWLRV